MICDWLNRDAEPRKQRNYKHRGNSLVGQSTNSNVVKGQLCISPVRMHAEWLPLCLTPCDCMDCSPPGFSVHGILQARILEWIAIHFSRGSSRPRDRTQVSFRFCTAGRFFTPEPSGKPHKL